MARLRLLAPAITFRLMLAIITPILPLFLRIALLRARLDPRLARSAALPPAIIPVVLHVLMCGTEAGAFSGHFGAQRTHTRHVPLFLAKRTFRLLAPARLVSRFSAEIAKKEFALVVLVTPFSTVVTPHL